MVYQSRRNPLVVVLIIFALGSLIVAGFAWVATGLAVVMLLFGIPRHYELSESALVVRSGFVRKRYPYESMVNVEMEPVPDGSSGNADCILVRLQKNSQVRLMPREAEALRAALEERVLLARGERV